MWAVFRLLLLSYALAWYHSIRRMRLLIGVLYWSNAQIAPFVRLLPPECKALHFSLPHSSYSIKFRLTEYYAPGRLLLADSRDIDLSCQLHISTFVALRDHISPTLQIRVGYGSLFCDPTRPDPRFSWPDPTGSMSVDLWLDPTRPSRYRPMKNIVNLFCVQRIM